MRPEQITILRKFGGNEFVVIVSDGCKAPTMTSALTFDEMLGMVAALTIPRKKKMVDISKHPLIRQAYELCRAIEDILVNSAGEPYTFRMNPLFLEAPKPPHPDGPDADKQEHLSTETL